MRKKSTYLYVLAAVAIIIAAGFIMNIALIKSAALSVFNMLPNPWVFGPAAVCAFIFMGSGRYWLINIGCALITALAVQYLVIGGGAGVYTIAYRTLAFLSVVYVLNLGKLLITK